jgi:hypothetical protein
MSKLEKYDHLSERLDDATPQLRLEKFSKILSELHKHGISLIELKNGCPVVGDDSGWRLMHNIITWEVFRVEDVVDMILNNRENNRNL